ncbi:class I SAM-dependent methyltransferase [Maridesulfovibrio sp.]|uniref:class I SAM-dependent methyltransferase n=1 Tax=Maridesulfovibrio sp. TaxID=2795000 RepID=UPI003BAB01ED
MSITPLDLAQDLVEIEPNFFATNKIPASEWMRLNANETGVTLCERAKIAMTTSSLDLPLYKKYLEQNLADLDRSACIMELGAGDGRITHELLRMGFSNIIAVEGQIQSIKRLYSSLDEEQLTRVRLICADVLDLSLAESSVDTIVSIETLCCLNDDFEKAMTHLSQSLTPKGRIIHAELMQEGNLFYALAFDDKDKIKSLLEGKTPTHFGAVRVFENNEMEQIYRQCGLTTIEKHAIPSLHGFLSRAYPRLGKEDPEVINLLQQTQSTLGHNDLARAMYFVAGKASI